MTDNDDGGPAFPRPASSADVGYVEPAEIGMSLRDWFAGQALAGIAATNILNAKLGREVATLAYAIADAMLEARES